VTQPRFQMPRVMELRADNLGTQEMTLNVGPQHPSTHGVLRLVVVSDGEVIKAVEPHLGFLHRGMEKNSEGREYRQLVPLWDRADYLSAMHMDYMSASAAEALLEIEVPRRSEYIRVIMLELQRIASHLFWFASLALDSGAVTPLFYAFREREKIIDLFDMASGARLLYNYIRPGGVRNDVSALFMEKLAKFVREFPKLVDEYEQLYTGNAIFRKRAENIGVLSREAALNYAVSGPVLRGSGVAWDIRKDEPYSVYPEMSFEIPVGEKGDVLDRYEVRFFEMRMSNEIVRQAMEGLPEGDIAAKLPPVIKPKAGEVYVRQEASRGELGCYLVSDGTSKPWRFHVHPPSYLNLGALNEMTRGYMFADLIMIFGSIDVVLGDVDK
jgi:NADH-quinone oxidoreductase subunit D